MKCPKCKVEMYNNCCVRCGYMLNGNLVADDQEKIKGIGQISNQDNIEKEQQLAYNDYIKANNDYKKHRNKKWLIIVSVVILVVAIIKIFFGTIEIGNPFYYPTHKKRFYQITINDQKVSSYLILKHSIPIIPFLVNFNSIYLGGNFVEDNRDKPTIHKLEECIIDIKTYSCYHGKYQIECVYDNQITKENNDTKYTKLKVVRLTNPYEEVYSGKFIHNITQYIKQKGEYAISIIAEHGLVDADVYLYIDVK